MATIYGTVNNDVLSNGTAGNDTFYTSLGGDYVQASGGSDRFVLGFTDSARYWTHSFNDFDNLDYRYAWMTSGLAEASELTVVVDLEAGTVQKFDAQGTLLGTDTVIGADGIFGTVGSDVFHGRDFWDYEEFRGFGGNDTIDGRGGNDGVNYRDAADAGIAVDFAAGTVTWLDSVSGTDTLRQIEIVTGTNFADTFDATGYGATSLNRNSFGGTYNLFNPLGGDDTIVGNGDTILNYGNNLGGAIAVDLSGQVDVGTAVNVITGFTDNPDSDAGITPGNILVSGVAQVRGGAYDDTLLGGGHVNGNGFANTLSGDNGFEGFRGSGGNDSIDGRSGFDRADYSYGNQAQGIVVDLGAGIVTGDPLLTGTDTLRGIEGISSTPMDDFYDASGFTLSDDPNASANSGDVVAVPMVPGESFGSSAFNEFRAYAGNDTVVGNDATRIDFRSMYVGKLTGAAPSVSVVFDAMNTGFATYGNTDGGLGTVTFTGVRGIVGGLANDSIVGADGYQGLRGYFGNDTIHGGNGGDYLAGYLGNDPAANNPTTLFTDDDSLDGGAGDDLLRGDFGADTLDGGSGADTMEGGTGDDVYIVDDIGDVVTESADAGVDRVESDVSYVLGDHLENLVLTGPAYDGTGNALDNVIGGNGLGNRLAGGDGNDTLSGAGGNDWLAGGNGDDLLDGAGGADWGDYRDAEAGVTVSLAVEGGQDTGGAGVDTLVGIEGLIGSAHDDVLSGGTGSDGGVGVFETFIGGAGDDTIDGGVVTDRTNYVDGNQVEYWLGATTGAIVNLQTGLASDGQGGTDTLSNISFVLGTSYADVFIGSNGNLFESFTGYAGDDYFDGGDLLVMSARINYGQSPQGVNVDFAKGEAEDGYGFVDTFTNINHVRGSNYADTLWGSDRTDVTETFEGRTGDDYVDGRGGTDSARYQGASSGVTVNLATGRSSGADGVDTLVGIENIRGSDHADMLIGNAGANRIEARYGDDTLVGAAGNDTLFGDLGDDLVQGGDGEDVLIASAGNDTLDGGAQSANVLDAAGNIGRTYFDIADYAASSTGVVANLGAGTATAGANSATLIGIEGVHGSQSSDVLTGDANSNVFRGNGGNDTMDGAGGLDIADYSNASGAVWANLGIGVATGAAGNDSLLGIEALLGSNYNDTLTGSSGNNAIRGGGGNDLLDGGAGIDRVDYRIATGAVTVNLASGSSGGADGVDTLSGFENARGSDVYGDTLIGSSGGNVLEGRGGNDVLDGGAGNDTLVGDEGNDRLDGNTGTDSLVGGAGSDTYVVDATTDVVSETVTTAADIDTVLSAVTWTLGANVENLTLTAAGSINGTGNALRNVLNGGSGNNKLAGDAGNDTLSGGAGNDTLDGGTGSDSLVGGLGSDTYVVDASTDVTVEGSTIATEIDTVQSTVTRSLGLNLENLTLTGTGAINGTGNELANTLLGNTGANQLSAGAGNDVLNGGAGNDLLTGGTGADRFVFASKLGSDTITDFASGTDDLVFSQAGLRIGDGDTLVEGAMLRSAPGGFASTAELVIFGTNVGALTSTAAAAAIGSATTAYTVGKTALFVVDTGASSGVFLFTSSGSDALVSAGELTLLATLTGVPATSTADFLFST